MIQGQLLEAQVGLLSAMADPTRLCILRLLHGKGPMSVTKIYEVLGKSQNLVSHHLRCLSTCGLVTVEKRGRMAIYSLANPEIARILDWTEREVINQAEQILSCRVVGKKTSGEIKKRGL